MNTDNLFAVDLGASGGKCFSGTFKEGSFVMREIHRFSHKSISFYIADKNDDISERTYWDDILLYQNIITGLQIHKREVSDIIDSIGIDTWGADGHFISNDGDMLGKIYCYRDHRLDDMVDKIKAKIDARRIYEITGIHFQPFNVSNQLYWFITNRSNLIQPGCTFLPIPSVFYYYLGGIKKVDSTWASVTQLMDARQKKWSEEILKKLDIPVEIMPEIVNPGTVIGRLSQPLAETIGINRAKLVAVAAHDTASAFAAAPVKNIDDALIISSGTWSLLGKLVPEPVTTEKAMVAKISNEGGIGNIRFLKNCMGTWLIQELRRIWSIADGKEPAWRELNEITETAPAFTSFIDPDYPGFYNPSDMELAIVDFCRKTGQSVPLDRGTFLRLIYESLALKYRMVNEQICDACGKTSKVVNIVGGGSKNKLMNQFTADALGITVITGPEEATAVGNFMVQALGLGLISSINEALPIIKNSFSIRTYKPENTNIWNKAYDKFRQIVNQYIA